MTALVKAVAPTRGTAWLSQGLGWVAGYVVKHDDVASARTPAALHAVLGLGHPGSGLSAEAGTLDTLRLPSASHLAILAPGTTDVAPAFRDHAPLSGTGFVESAEGFVPYWWIAPSALPAGTELWRLHADGREQLLARYPHVAAGWEWVSADASLPPIPPRSPELVGVWAEIGGERLLADVLPDGTVIVCSPVAREGMQQSARGVWWRTAERAELGQVYAVRVVGTWRGRPVQLVGVERTPLGDRAHVVDLGHDALDAEALGLTRTDAGVHEGVVPLAEVQGLGEERRAVQAGAPVALVRDGSADPASTDPEAEAWLRFEEGLAQTLGEIRDRVVLIVSDREHPRRYVQFAGMPDSVQAEASGTYDGTDEDALRAAGWVPPVPGEMNWSSHQANPIPDAERVALAARCVRALRDGHGLSSPGELGYQAWRDAAGADRGDPALELPALGLPRS